MCRSLHAVDLQRRVTQWHAGSWLLRPPRETVSVDVLSDGQVRKAVIRRGPRQLRHRASQIRS